MGWGINSHRSALLDDFLYSGNESLTEELWMVYNNKGASGANIAVMKRKIFLSLEKTWSR
jgi:hypothetical protein